jgi:hypothetical protein
MAAHRDEGRRVIDHPQAGRIAGLTQRQEAHAADLAALILCSASAREQMRADPLAPPRRARCGSAASAACAPPN